MSDEIVREDNTDKEVDASILEIITKADKVQKLSQKEMEKLIKEAQESINFIEKLKEINLESDTFVIYTDGNEQLLYDNGEFFIVSTTDSKKEKKKLKKQQAKDMYIEYFIKYQLNPIITQRKQQQLNMQQQNKQIEKPEVVAKKQEQEKETQKEKVVAKKTEKTQKAKDEKSKIEQDQSKKVVKKAKDEEIIR